jgi:lipoprotein-releasing system ATP-binding protein
MEYAIRCRNLHRTFYRTADTDLEIIKDISLDIEKNKITVIVGASGAGKSTLLHIIGGLDKPDDGRVFIGEQEIYTLNDEQISFIRNNQIGFIFQFHHLLPEFTAMENISIPMMIAGKSLKEASLNSIELLEAVKLGDRADHKPSELSGGEQQRVAMARALANRPSIILADEPTGNLDSENSKVMHEIIMDLKKKFGLTFLIVTHNPELVKLADRVLIMKDGRLFESKTK